MDNKPKDALKTKDVLKQLQTEMRQLQTTVNALQRARRAGRASDAALPRKERGDKVDWVVQYAVTHRRRRTDACKTGTLSFSEAQLARVTDDAAAMLGYALSSPQKVALLRALLTREAESAAALGETAQLSTGSLYHHLHDLMHAGLIGQSARNRYVLTERGRRVLMVLLALAAQSLRSVPMPEAYALAVEVIAGLPCLTLAARTPPVTPHSPSSCMAWGATKKVACFRPSTPSPGAACAPSPSMPGCTATAPARRRVSRACNPTMCSRWPRSLKERRRTFPIYWTIWM